MRGVAVFTVGAANSYSVFVLTWGATRDEVVAALPGDDLLPDPDGQTTRAITVDAASSDAFPVAGTLTSTSWRSNEEIRTLVDRITTTAPAAGRYAIPAPAYPPTSWSPTTENDSRRTRYVPNSTEQQRPRDSTTLLRTNCATPMPPP